MAPDKTNWAPVPGGCTGPACDNPYEPTPQAREGPLGSKTLCNACGVHYSRYLRKQPANQKRAAFNACYHVFNCYQTSAECAAGVPLHPDELIRRIEALQASLVLSTPALPAPVEAPGTPPLAAAAAAAPEFSDTGSQEEVMEVPGPTQLKVCMPRKEKGTQLHQYVEAVVAAYNKRAVQAAALPAGDRAAAEADLDAALALADISLATSQVAQHSPHTLKLKRGLKQQQLEEEEEDEDNEEMYGYSNKLSSTATPKRRRTGQQQQQQQQDHKMPFLPLPPGMLTSQAQQAAAAGAATADNHTVVGAGGMDAAGGAGMGHAGAAQVQGNAPQPQQQQQAGVAAAAGAPAQVPRHSGRASRPPRKLEAFVRSPGKEMFRLG